MCMFAKTMLDEQRARDYTNIEVKLPKRYRALQSNHTQKELHTQYTNTHADVIVTSTSSQSSH